MKIALNVSKLHVLFIFCLEQSKSIENTFQETTFKVEKNSRTFQDFLNLPKILQKKI